MLGLFCVRGTTGIAANLCGRRFAGIEQERYRAENAERLERVYLVDYEDKIAAVPDDARSRIEMVADRRRDLFATPFGKYFHDQGLAIEPLAAHIISQHEPDYSNIHEFMDKYIAYQIAKEHCRKEEEVVGEAPAAFDIISELQVIFHNNREEAAAFIHRIDGAKSTFITEEVNRLLREEKITKAGCKRDLWQILHENKYYKYSESNWNRRVNA